MRDKVAFVDFENVGFSWLNTEDRFDKVFIFVNKFCNITGKNIKDIYKITKEIKVLVCDTGTRNSLDFQLDSYLGYYAGCTGNRDDEYVIVSKDKGFDHVVNFMSKLGYNVIRQGLEPNDNYSKCNVEGDF